MNESVILMAYVIMVVIGVIIGIIVGFHESIIDKNRSVLTKKEYHTYMSQTKQAAAVAHGGGKLCPDKDVMEVVNEGAQNSNLQFPDIDF